MKIIKSKKLLIFYTALSLIILGCGSSVKTAQALKSITGEIVVVGNEPFTNLALKTDFSKVYILKCDNKFKTILQQNQGRIAKIFYKNVDNTKRPGVIDVENVEFISKKIE